MSYESGVTSKSLPHGRQYNWKMISATNLRVGDTIPIIEQRAQEHLDGAEPWGKKTTRRIICAFVGEARFTTDHCDAD